jgi:cell division septation protein DedD
VPKNEDGEFELILGNRQLLSVFFIVVILLGVFFTMGYIVGRNSGPVSGPEIAAATARKPDSKPLAVDSAAPDTAAPAPPASPPTQTARQQPPPAERPKPAEPVKEAPPRKPEPVKTEKAAPSDQPVSGQTYLQLTATSKREADLYVELLRKKGFEAFAAEIPEKPSMFRVLVGPLGDGSINKVRADLEQASFPGNKAIKKTF